MKWITQTARTNDSSFTLSFTRCRDICYKSPWRARARSWGSMNRLSRRLNVLLKHLLKISLRDKGEIHSFHRSQTMRWNLRARSIKDQWIIFHVNVLLIHLLKISLKDKGEIRRINESSFTSTCCWYICYKSPYDPINSWRNWWLINPFVMIMRCNNQCTIGQWCIISCGDYFGIPQAVNPQTMTFIARIIVHINYNPIVFDIHSVLIAIDTKNDFPTNNKSQNFHPIVP